MPIYFGHPNTKGLSVSPALKALNIDLLRASPSAVRIIANPRVVQDGYQSYVTHISAFMQAYVKQETISLGQAGYPVLLKLDDIIRIPTPPLVIDYKGQIPSSHVETLSNIGFDRIKMNRQDNILRFDDFDWEEARKIRNTNPNLTTPAPIGTINLSSMDDWVVALKILSNFLRAHTYPAFTDDEHIVDAYDDSVEISSNKRAGSNLEKESSKQPRTEGESSLEEGEIEDAEIEMTDAPVVSPKKEIKLRRAKPPSPSSIPWGMASRIPNTSGLFFPFVPELASYDKTTVPDLVERFFIRSLGNTPEHQVERMERLRSSWGIIGQTDAGNVLAHLAKVIHLSLTSQCRVYPIIREKIYQGSVLCGGRFYLGSYGKVVFPISFDKLQEETGSYHFHSKVLDEIVALVDEGTKGEVTRPTTMRELRTLFLSAELSEESRDEIRKLAVHLQFKEKFLAVNAQTLKAILNEMDDLASPDDSLPLHHSALFSRDPVFVALSAFGFQAPSFLIDNCPKVAIKGNVPPQTLVVRQKPLDIATLDWKKMFEAKEIRNNPKNLSRANRDRSFVGNDKVVVWGELVNAMSAGGAETISGMEKMAVQGNDDDVVDEW